MKLWQQTLLVEGDWPLGWVFQTEKVFHFFLSFLHTHLSFLSESVLLPQCQAALDNLSQLIRSQSCLQKPVSCCWLPIKWHNLGSYKGDQAFSLLFVNVHSTPKSWYLHGSPSEMLMQIINSSLQTPFELLTEHHTVSRNETKSFLF